MTCRLLATALLTLSSGAILQAEPPRETYGISRLGTVFRFNQSDGVAVPVRTLNNSRIGCIYYYSFVYSNGYFYASSEGPGATGKLIRFRFRADDEELFVSPFGPVAIYMTPGNLSGQEALFMAVRYVQGSSGSYGVLNLVSKEFTTGYEQGTSDYGVCGKPSTVASGLFLLEYFGSGLVWARTILGPGISHISALGKFVSVGGGTCLQVECLLTDDGQPTNSFVGTGLGTSADVALDPVTGEVWAIGRGGLLRKLKGSSNYCTGNFQGLPAAKKGVDDSPRIVGIGNTFPAENPIVGTTRAPNYFDNPLIRPSGIIWKPIEMLLSQ